MGFDAKLEHSGFTSPVISQSGGKTEVKTTIQYNGRSITLAIDFEGKVKSEVATSALNKLAHLVKKGGLEHASSMTFHVSKDGKIDNETSIIKIIDNNIASEQEELYQAAIDLDAPFLIRKQTIEGKICSLENMKKSVLHFVKECNKTMQLSRLSQLPTTSEKDLFTPVVKHALTELYTAEAVFLGKLQGLAKEKSLTKEDKLKLKELTANTESILKSLTAFEQLGVKQEARLRTLRQDLAMKITYESQKSGRLQKPLVEIVTLQAILGELSGKLAFAKTEAAKKQLEDDIQQTKAKLTEAFSSLHKLGSKEAKSIASMYHEVESLTKEKASLPKTPVGLFDNLTATFNAKTMAKQYQLLTHFQHKLEALKQKNDPNFSKFQELGNKITRYPMLVDAILQNLPPGREQVALKQLHSSLKEHAQKANQ